MHRDTSRPRAGRRHRMRRRPGDRRPRRRGADRRDPRRRRRHLGAGLERAERDLQARRDARLGRRVPEDLEPRRNRGRDPVVGHDDHDRTRLAGPRRVERVRDQRPTGEARRAAWARSHRSARHGPRRGRRLRSNGFQRAPNEHAREVLAVLGRRVEVLRRFGAFGRVRGRVRRGRTLRERLFDPRGAQRRANPCSPARRWCRR